MERKSINLSIKFKGGFTMLRFIKNSTEEHRRKREVKRRERFISKAFYSKRQIRRFDRYVLKIEKGEF
jgi:hypothetical protein